MWFLQARCGLLCTTINQIHVLLIHVSIRLNIKKDMFGTVVTEMVFLIYKEIRTGLFLKGFFFPKLNSQNTFTFTYIYSNIVSASWISPLLKKSFHSPQPCPVMCRTTGSSSSEFRSGCDAFFQPPHLSRPI